MSTSIKEDFPHTRIESLPPYLKAFREADIDILLIANRPFRKTIRVRRAIDLQKPLQHPRAAAAPSTAKLHFLQKLKIAQTHKTNASNLPERYKPKIRQNKRKRPRRRATGGKNGFESNTASRPIYLGIFSVWPILSDSGVANLSRFAENMSRHLFAVP